MHRSKYFNIFNFLFFCHRFALCFHRGTDGCGNTPTYFLSTSNYKCQINDVNAYTGLYMGSTSYVCHGGTTPLIQGYLGTHCSTPTSVTTLTQTCKAKPFWDTSLYYSYLSYSCLPKVPYTPQPSQWLATASFPIPDCKSTPILVTGYAVGACYSVYSSNSTILGSLILNCSGYSLYGSYDCSGPKEFRNILTAPLGTCAAHNPSRGTSSRVLGVYSMRTFCSSSLSLSSVLPSSAEWITESYYDNDVCYDTPVRFTSYPLNVTFQTRASNATVTCSNGMPELVETSNTSFTSSVNYLSTLCSYTSPGFTTRFQANGVPFSSVKYSSCPSPTATVVEVEKENVLKPGDMALSKGGLAGIVFLMLIVGAVTALLFVRCGYCRWAVTSGPGRQGAAFTKSTHDRLEEENWTRS